MPARLLPRRDRLLEREDGQVPEQYDPIALELFKNAIFSIAESFRRLNIPIRKYLGDVLPGLAGRSIQSLAELTPTAYAARLAI